MVSVGPSVSSSVPRRSRRCCCRARATYSPPTPKVIQRVRSGRTRGPRRVTPRPQRRQGRRSTCRALGHRRVLLETRERSARVDDEAADRPGVGCAAASAARPSRSSDRAAADRALRKSSRVLLLSAGAARMSRAACDAFVDRRDAAVELPFVDLRRITPIRGPGRHAERRAGGGPGAAARARRAARRAARARSRNQPDARSSRSRRCGPGSPTAATRASSSRSTFCASRRNAPSPTGVADLEKASGFRWWATMPSTWPRTSKPSERVHVEPIEQPRGRRHARLLVIHRADPPVDERGRRRLAEIVAERRRASP